MNTRATAANPFLEDFAAHAAELPGAGVPWLDARRAEAIKIVRANGVPHRRIEAWKYSDLRNALETPKPSAPAGDRHLLDGGPFSRLTGPALSIAGGMLQQSSVRGLSLWEGVELYDLRSLDKSAPEWVSKHLGTLAQTDSMRNASLALMRGGVALRVRSGVQISAPFLLRFLDSGRDEGLANQARVLIVLEEGAALTLLESHEEQSFFNLGMEIVLDRGARLTHVRLAGRGPDSLQNEDIDVAVSANARYRAHFSQMGARLSRTELSIVLNGEGADAELSGVSALGGDLHADITTHIDHAAGKTTSRQLFKNVAGGAARAVYQGKITVRKGANGSDSRQTAKALLLGARAEADLKPELEIYADDVKCAHGAAVGDLDADSLFYLRSRGIPEAEARAMLIRGFLEEAVDEIGQEDIRAAVWNFVEQGLAHAVEAQP
jgi:Fe-S cluster assembly protein SufD